MLEDSDCSGYLDFVIKDSRSDTWYDSYGENFHVPLQRQDKVSDGDQNKSRPLPENQIPDVPDNLAGVWAYIKWEASGCPHRSQEESDAEYRQGIQVRTAGLQQSTVYFVPGRGICRLKL